MIFQDRNSEVYYWFVEFEVFWCKNWIMRSLGCLVMAVARRHFFLKFSLQVRTTQLFNKNSSNSATNSWLMCLTLENYAPFFEKSCYKTQCWVEMLCYVLWQLKIHMQFHKRYVVRIHTLHIECILHMHNGSIVWRYKNNKYSRFTTTTTRILMRLIATTLSHLLQNYYPQHPHISASALQYPAAS